VAAKSAARARRSEPDAGQILDYLLAP
jgi:hypothetical protein